MALEFTTELAQLRFFVSELQCEREELRFKLGQRGVATPAKEGPSQFGHRQHQLCCHIIHWPSAVAVGAARTRQC